MTSTRGILRTVGWTLLLGAVCGLGVIYAIEHLYGVPLTDTSFRFERPWFGVLFAGALLAFLARTWWFRFHAPRILMSRAHELHTAPKGWRTHLVPLAPALRTVALTLLCFGLMGPQSIHAKDTTEVEGIDIALVLDLSLSMQAADIRPNRFEATKEVVNEFIRRRPNDRIGAVLFGRDAYTLLPLTTDHEALSQMITELQLGSIDGRGTAIGNGVATALNRLRMSKAKSKVVILLTD
ncbi:MAG: VWA domain-containing protein, partial [Myxococcales bacterium]|nr:VWA domain-containing protein [Myxococcales bacterium]